jgi:hypothetical protein
MRRGHRWRAAGQKAAEFAILMGTVAAAVLSMTPLVQQALRGGVRSAGERMLNAPLTNALPNFATNDTTKALEVVANQALHEAGAADFARTTNISGSVRGRSVNEDARLRVFEE